MATTTAPTQSGTTVPTSPRKGAPWRTTIVAVVGRHAVLAYYALTFAISWGGFLLVVGGPGAFPATPEQFEALMPLAVLAMLAGPPVAGLLSTGVVSGRAGYRELRSRLVRWRVGARWYALALLFAPLLYLALLLPLSRLSAAFVPGILASDAEAPMLVLGVAIALGAGLLEELGWTGFAVPMLRRRHGGLATGLLVGALWAAWHWLGQLWAPGAASGAFAVGVLLVDPLFYMVGYRVLMVWVYDRTECLPVAVVMHTSLTASARLLGPPAFAGMAGVPLLAFDLIWAAAVWAVVGAIAVANGGRLSRPPLRAQVA
jgi:membrane protease YdiL (CAAX protease family)